MKSLPTLKVVSTEPSDWSSILRYPEVIFPLHTPGYDVRIEDGWTANGVTLTGHTEGLEAIVADVDCRFTKESAFLNNLYGPPVPRSFPYKIHLEYGDIKTWCYGDEETVAYLGHGGWSKWGKWPTTKKGYASRHFEKDGVYIGPETAHDLWYPSDTLKDLGCLKKCGRPYLDLSATQIVDTGLLERCEGLSLPPTCVRVGTKDRPLTSVHIFYLKVGPGQTVESVYIEGSFVEIVAPERAILVLGIGTGQIIDPLPGIIASASHYLARDGEYYEEGKGLAEIIHRHNILAAMGADRLVECLSGTDRYEQLLATHFIKAIR